MAQAYSLNGQVPSRVAPTLNEGEAQAQEEREQAEVERGGLAEARHRIHDEERFRSLRVIWAAASRMRLDRYIYKHG